MDPTSDIQNGVLPSATSIVGASSFETTHHAPPAIPVAAPAPIQREQREKKESLKKREAGSGTTNGALAKKKAGIAMAAYPSPQRFNLNPPKPQDYEPPRDDVLTEHEPVPFFVPGQETQLYKPAEVAENKRGYRYTRAIADPRFPHKQFYRSTSPRPHNARLSFEDADKWMHFSRNAMITTNEKGWRMARANVCAREGTLYYEIKIHRGIPGSGPPNEATGPAPHVRFGWARREAPLDAPVGFDGYSYGLTDMRFETMHRSRPGKLFHGKKGKAKAVKGVNVPPTTVALGPEDQHIKEGDVIGVEIQLPSLALHQKIVSGVYNPAVDIGDGFEDSSGAPAIPNPDDTPVDIIRDRIPVPYRGNFYFEVLDHVSSKAMDGYADRTLALSSLTTSHGAASNKDAIKASPNPNHELAPLRTLPHSAIRVYKNGKLIGTAFENLLSFLPPSSQPSKQQGAREGNFDDGMVGYFPAVACFFGGIAEVNFGDAGGFWFPPSHLQPQQSNGTDVEMADVDAGGQDMNKYPDRWLPGSRARPVGDRYREQIAEDIVWDLVDEVDFYIQDGGSEPKANQG